MPSVLLERTTYIASMRLPVLQQVSEPSVCTYTLVWCTERTSSRFFFEYAQAKVSGQAALSHADWPLRSCASHQPARGPMCTVNAKGAQFQMNLK